MVKDIQIRSSPASIGIDQLARLMNTFPNMFERSELEIKQRIQALKDERKRKEDLSKVSEDIGSSLPQPTPNKKKPKMADLMFDMEDDQKESHELEATLENLTIDDTSNNWEPVQVKHPKPGKLKQKLLLDESPPQEFWLKRGSFTPPRLHSLPTAEEFQDTSAPKKGWNTFNPSPKVDLKSVLDAGSPTQHRRRSNIAIGLQDSPPASPNFATSNEEKKPVGQESPAPTPHKPMAKQKWQPIELGQPAPTLPPLGSTPPYMRKTSTSNSPTPAPWQAPVAGQKVQLKDILDAGSSSSPSSSKDRPVDTLRRGSTPGTAPMSMKAPTSSFQASGSPGLDFQLSMQDIIAQQALEKDIIQQKVAKRSLEEIQQEQEFLEWWNKEAERVRLEEEAQANKAKKKSLKGRVGGAHGGGERVKKEKGHGAEKPKINKSAEATSEKVAAKEATTKGVEGSPKGGKIERGEGSSRGGRSGERGGRGGGRGRGRGGRGRGEGGRPPAILGVSGIERHQNAAVAKAQ